MGDDAALQADIPYSALEMLTSTAQDSVFYRVDGPGGFMTGYADLPLAEPGADGAGYTDAVFAGLIAVAAFALIVPMIMRARGKGQVLSQMASDED